MQLSLCCISNVLAERGIKFQTMTLTRFLALPRADAVRILSERILNNFIVTNAIIQYCANCGIAGYRLSSTLVPVISHPIVNLRLQDLPNWSDIRAALDAISRTIKLTGVRVSAHPSEYITLTSLPLFVIALTTSLSTPTFLTLSACPKTIARHSTFIVAKTAIQ